MKLSGESLELNESSIAFDIPYADEETMNGSLEANDSPTYAV
ncbi:hypothetical protein GCM10023310_32760 [Paenibacillus vulneris]|uniref:Uncharacterized protein n=1 Tax=Paenibacillus vulneris TaxID=1133364 RepID=A0ABW3UQ02_9BACL|nr:hypothetical protein [Paenibacillus sp. 32352]